jgi:hypothetical protein
MVEEWLVLNSVLCSKNILHKTKKKKKLVYQVSSQKYFTIWGRNMDTKHNRLTNYLQLRWIFGDLLQNEANKRSEMAPLEQACR